MRSPLKSFIAFAAFLAAFAIVANCVNLTAETKSVNPYWAAPPVNSVSSIGVISIPLPNQGVLKMYPTLATRSGVLVVKSTAWDSTGTVLNITYGLGSTTVHATIQIASLSAGVQATVDADQPVITTLDMGRWPPSLALTSIAVPYYSPGVYYSPSASVYANQWFDWHSTNASKTSGTSALYSPKTDGTLNLLHEQINLVASSNIDAVMPSLGNPASPYLATQAGRMVLDIWDEGFSSVAQSLSSLGDYGIGSCTGIIHEWQHQGYDNALPEHYSANPTLGGDMDLQTAIAQGNANGCLMAVHENYSDYYPNYPQFTSKSVANGSSGVWLDSWLNSVTGIQSLSTKATWMLPNAETQSPQIHTQFGTTAAYLDEHSALPPFAHEDMDSSTTGAAMQRTMFAANQALWNYERQTHQGPVLGEGSAHWFYSGLLDGVEAQQEAGYPMINTGASLPLFVDFDLLNIHPVQANHGMGYYERWTAAKTTAMTTTLLDAYRMQEIAFGHAPFLSKGLWSNIPHAFVESNLVTPVASSYGTAAATSIQYRMNNAWVTSSVAAPAKQFTTVLVGYSNGLSLLANSSNSSITWNGIKIPQYGWAAKSASLLAYTAQCGSAICDFAQTSKSLFANSRNLADAQVGMGYALASVTSVKSKGGRSLTIGYNWNVYRAPGSQFNYSSFVHFVKDSAVTTTNPGVVFQDDHLLSTIQWQPGQDITDGPYTMSIPSSVPDGRYSIRIGMFDPATGIRLPLSGINDGI